MEPPETRKQRALQLKGQAGFLIAQGSSLERSCNPVTFLCQGWHREGQSEPSPGVRGDQRAPSEDGERTTPQGLFPSFKLGFYAAQLGEPPDLHIELINSNPKQRPIALLEGMENLQSNRCHRDRQISGLPKLFTGAKG